MRIFNNLHDFYTSSEWHNFRQFLIELRTNKDDGILYDEYNGKPILKSYDIVLHHIKPLTLENVNDVNISLNPENILICSVKSHNQIHKRFGFDMPKRVFIVYGAPCSGKTTWANEAAGRYDLIIDVDNIWQMITINSKYDKPSKLKENIFAVRDCLIDQIKTRRGNWQNAYIVGGYPLLVDRENLSRMLQAEIIFIDTDKDTCLMRARHERPKEWQEFIEDWFYYFVPDPPRS